VNPNDKLHRDALAVLKQMKPSRAERSAKDTVANYNERRNEATVRFGKIASAIWEKLEAGESVGGAVTKEGWCSVTGIKIRWAQTAIQRYRAANGDALSAPDADPTLHPLGGSIYDLDFDSERAYVELEVSEWRDIPGRRIYSVIGDLTVSVEAPDVPLKNEMPCPACGHRGVTVKGGNYGDHITGTKSTRRDGSSYCKMSGKPVVITEKFLVAALYKKVERTLRTMRLWRDSLKRDEETIAQMDAQEMENACLDLARSFRDFNEIMSRGVNPTDPLGSLGWWRALEYLALAESRLKEAFIRGDRSPASIRQYARFRSKLLLGERYRTDA
jgi:hypothetical protein